ncbi:fimbrial protein [Erwinia sp. Eh17-17]|uniref:fimbrial protein n=1 Tax=Erwinia sp. Eh17-17 TaxID=3080330 RepID=UPI0032094218
MNNMQLIKKGVMRSTLLLSLLMAATGASALTCEFSPGSALITMQMPIQGSNITVGPDVPNGTVIHEQYYRPSGPISFHCSNNSGIYQPSSSYRFTHRPYPVSSSDGGVSAYAGKIMETNVPGIGVLFRRGTDASVPIVPFSQNSWGGTNAAPAYTFTANNGYDFDMVLIKIGDIQPGVLDGASLPTLGSFFEASNITPIKAVETSFVGSLNIVSATCTTPDVTVNMGSYDIGQFKNAGDGTPWKDASIIMTNCPRFYGKLTDGRNSYYSDNGNSAIGAMTPNSISVSIQPNTPVTDSVKGIFNLQSGSGTASGVGIQLAYGATGQVSPPLVNFAIAKNTLLGSADIRTRAVALVARYIKTSGPVTPGKANATATFTINYY